MAGFLDPEAWAHEYWAEKGLQYDFNEYIVEMMEKYKTEAVKRFYIVSHQDYAEAIATTIAFGFTQGLKEAVEIVNKLSLNDKHIAALNDDAKEMNQILSDENYEDKKYNDYMYQLEI